MTFTGFNTGSDYAFHEPPHPLERIQRKAASINNDNESVFDNIFETHHQSSEQYIRRRQSSINIDNNQNNENLGNAIETITETSDSEDAEKQIHKHLEDNILGTLKSKAGNLIDSTEIVKDSF